jgi:hypothetical protein
MRIRDQHDSWRGKVEKLLAELRPREFLSRVMVKSRGRVVFLKVEEIDWIETSANYVEVHAGKQSFLLRETLGSLEEKLDPKQFARVHRTTIVNCGPDSGTAAVVAQRFHDRPPRWSEAQDEPPLSSQPSGAASELRDYKKRV